METDGSTYLRSVADVVGRHDLRVQNVGVRQIRMLARGPKGAGWITVEGLGGGDAAFFALIDHFGAAVKSWEEDTDGGEEREAPDRDAQGPEER